MSKNFTWKDVLSKEKNKPYFIKTLQAVFNDRAAGIRVYPAENDVFNAFRLTELSDIKVVILGQDPYHGPNQAHGLAFSVLPHTRIPPSLLNIYKELEQDIPSFVFPQHGCLKYWAKQGVLLLNTVLTVIEGKPNSHAHLGWEKFTNQVILNISQYCNHVIFLLWGASAQKKSSMIDNQRHFILKAAHPSPLSAHRGFFGCNHFSKTNEILSQFHQEQINWNPIL